MLESENVSRKQKNTIWWIRTAIWIQYRCYTEKYNKIDMYSNTDTIRMPYGEIQSAASFPNKQYNSWWKVQKSTLQFYSIGFFHREEHTWRHTKLVTKQL